MNVELHMKDDSLEFLNVLTCFHLFLSGQTQFSFKEDACKKEQTLNDIDPDNFIFSLLDTKFGVRSFCVKSSRFAH